MVDDPFAEPDDADRTVIRPNPGGRRKAAAAQPAAMAPVAQPAAPYDAADPAGFGVPAGQGGSVGIPQQGASQQRTNSDPIAMTGMNQLNACATPLFSLISRIRNRAQHMDPNKLRNSVVAEIRAFENRALQAGIDAQNVKVARYAICATLDDVVLNTPWGGQSVWAQKSMVGTFHRETVGGDRFYDLLARLEKDSATNIELLEFMYQCLSLGFEGRLRVEQGGPDKHLQIRNGLARIIRAQRGMPERDLSPHWKGLQKPHRTLSLWKPVWIAVACTAVILALSFTGLSWALGQSSENVIGRLAVLDTGVVPQLLRRAPPPPPPPPRPAEIVKLDKISGFLSAEIDEGIVEVFEDGNSLIIRLVGVGMFGSGSDSLLPAFEVPVSRVAEALESETGPVIIVGHSDNIPIRGGRFKNNAGLSLARAESVQKFIAGKISDSSRLLSEGRAAKEPIADNATKEGRARNRRIEILLIKVDDL